MRLQATRSSVSRGHRSIRARREAGNRTLMIGSSTGEAAGPRAPMRRCCEDASHGGAGASCRRWRNARELLNEDVKRSAIGAGLEATFRNARAHNCALLIERANLLVRIQKPFFLDSASSHPTPVSGES